MDDADVAARQAAKKAAKKAKKAAGTEAEAVAEAATVPSNEPAPKKEKKKKRQDEAAAAGIAEGEPAPKKRQQGARVDSLARARIGDAALAAAGPTFRKDFYTEAASVTRMSAAEVAALRESLRIVVDGPPLRPVRTFADAGFPASLLQACKGFAKPSPIQAQAWPLVLSGHDMVGIASTGSGKTLAFALPAFVHLLDQPAVGPGAKRGPVCLVLAPTRELAQQIHGVFETAATACGQRTACIFGGVPKGPQKAALAAGVAAVAATPGRAQDLLEEGCLILSRVTYLVLDEADRMLDLGFEPAIRALARVTRADRQTLMFSATWPEQIRSLAAEFMVAPARVTIGSAELAASHAVTQHVEVLESSARDSRLVALMKGFAAKGKGDRVIVFVLYKAEAPRVEALLERQGLAVIGIHGDKSQTDRNRAVACFKDGSRNVLVATDVAARGLDIPGVEYVVNYSFPLTIEDYVHRIGRTGRAGRTGIAHTFFTANDKARAGELINVLKEAAQAVPADLLKFGTTVKKKESSVYGAHFKPLEGWRAEVTAKKTTFESDDDE